MEVMAWCRKRAASSSGRERTDLEDKRVDLIRRELQNPIADLIAELRADLLACRSAALLALL
jgi:hypothetical protein